MEQAHASLSSKSPSIVVALGTLIVEVMLVLQYHQTLAYHSILTNITPHFGNTTFTMQPNLQHHVFCNNNNNNNNREKKNLSSKHSIYPNYPAPKTEKRKHFKQQTKSGPAAKCTTTTAAVYKQHLRKKWVLKTTLNPKTLNPKPTTTTTTHLG